MVSDNTKILLATITEGIVLLFVTFIVIMLYVRYIKRKKPAALTLAVAFTFWEIANICLFVMRLLTYLKLTGYIVSSIDFAGVGINLGYIFSAISNVLIMTFVAIVFSQSPMFRRSGMFIPFAYAIFNGVTIGLLIAATIREWPTPLYSIETTIYHLFLTIMVFASLIVFTIRPIRRAQMKWEKAGFGFIIASGVTGILIFVSFAVDVVLGDIQDKSYTIFFFIAYVFAVLMIVFAYLGYVMPNFVRNWFKEKQELSG